MISQLVKTDLKMEEIQNVLIVDDNEVDAFVAKKLLSIETSIPSIGVAQNGLQALTHIRRVGANRKSLPDVILLDFNMPIMNGTEFLDRYQSVLPLLAKKSIIIVLSSSMVPEEVLEIKKHPLVFDFIPKPLQVDKLNTILKRFSGEIDLPLQEFFSLHRPFLSEDPIQQVLTPANR